MDPMVIVVRAFAGARDIVGARSIEIEVPATVTVGQVWEALCARYPGLTGLRLRGLALNHAYVSFEQPVHEGDEVAIIPPVSGG